MSETIDFLIVGGGIAGALMQLELESRGCSAHLYDVPENNVSSRVAAGIANPVTGKYYSLSWRAQEMFPELSSFYQDIGARFDAKCFIPMPIRRVFSNAGEQNTWITKSLDAPYSSFTSFQKDAFKTSTKNHGSLVLNYGGYLKTSEFLDQYRQYHRGSKVIKTEHLDYSLINPKKSTYKEVSYGKIIFADGFAGAQNPYFSHLPFTLNKGELLEIESKELPQDEILIGSVFIIPLGNRRFKVGATYDHNDLSLNTTENKKTELMERFKRMTHAEFKVINHWVGIRPAVKDRRPLIGIHAQWNNLCIFNGFGSKAVSTVPVLSKEFADFLLEGTALHPEVDIKRFC